ncbi:MAG: AsnC family transcriptional regulator [Thermoplasmatales archaeon]|nr:MAG: AsnC family transcriptional regulator [Thermoplasmatales archaeon]
MQNLDSKDHKIIYHLFLNSRESLSSIGKKVGLPKTVIKYRVDRLVKENIIQNFNAMIDVFKLGYSVYRLNLVFQYASPEKEKEIIDYFTDYKNTWSAASAKGRYDFTATILVKNPNEFYSFYEETLKRYRYYLKEIDFSQLYEKFGYKHATLFTESSHSDEKAYEYRYTGQIADIDNVDYQILCLLARNSRIPSIEIAKKINMTSTTIINRITKLINMGIIQRYSISVDTNKLGFKPFNVNLSLRNYDKKNHIISYLSSIPFIWEIHKAVGGYDLELSIFTLNFEHFHELMEDIRNKFPEDITNYDYLYVTKIHKTNFLPELE